MMWEITIHKVFIPFLQFFQCTLNVNGLHLDFPVLSILARTVIWDCSGVDLGCLGVDPPVFVHDCVEM
jgi:hypothetical protein